MEEENELKLGDLTLNKKQLSECKKYFIDDKKTYVVFYHTNDDGYGFDFLCVKWTGSYSDAPQWSDETNVSIICHGSAAFDGIRHIYFGNDDESGYIYYPELTSITKILDSLQVLERLYCEELC